jgi:hypothetical protein
MAGKARLHQIGIAERAVFVEVTKAPAARSGVLSRIFDHKLNIRGRPRNERLGAAEDFVVFVRRRVTPVQGGND